MGAQRQRQVRRSDPGTGHPQRDQVRLLPNRLRALRPLGVPHLEAQVEDGQRDRRKEDGGPSLSEKQRDGAVQLPAAAASGVRYLQELRGALPRGFHGRQRCGDAGQGGLLRAQRGGRCRGQEEVSGQRLIPSGSVHGRSGEGLMLYRVASGSRSSGSSYCTAAAAVACAIESRCLPSLFSASADTRILRNYVGSAWEWMSLLDFAEGGRD